MTTRKKSIHTQEYRAIISKLIKSRKKFNLTQIEVARLLNCSQSYISKIEKCQIRIDFIQLKVFAETALPMTENLFYVIEEIE